MDYQVHRKQSNMDPCKGGKNRGKKKKKEKKGNKYQGLHRKGLGLKEEERKRQSITDHPVCNFKSSEEYNAVLSLNTNNVIILQSFYPERSLPSYSSKSEAAIITKYIRGVYSYHIKFYICCLISKCNPYFTLSHCRHPRVKEKVLPFI